MVDYTNFSDDELNIDVKQLEDISNAIKTALPNIHNSPQCDDIKKALTKAVTWIQSNISCILSRHPLKNGAIECDGTSDTDSNTQQQLQKVKIDFEELLKELA